MNTGPPYDIEKTFSGMDLQRVFPFSPMGSAAIGSKPIDLVIPPIQEFKEPKEDLVNHPTHYTSHPSDVECIEITQHYNFCIGNAIKYLWRNGLKEKGAKEKQIEDLKKAVWYINREISNLENDVYE